MGNVRARVMVVDDDEALRDSMCELLEEDGFSVLWADSGESALERLRHDEVKPALILLDLMMPAMSGWQFRQEQLRDPRLSEIPVVVMTASRDVQGLDPEDVVFKPLKLTQLVELVRKHASDSEPLSRAPGPDEPTQLPLPMLAVQSFHHDVEALLRELDWAATPLGPPSRWPSALRSALELCLQSAQPACLWWGRELICLYNDAFRAIAGSKHPAALGLPAREVWPEAWALLGPRAERALAGDGSSEEALSLFVSRDGRPEEAHWTVSFSPVADGPGPGGVWVTVNDQTARVLAERRAGTLTRLASRALGARSTAEAARACAEALAAEPLDVRFALVYLLSEDGLGFTLLAAAGVKPGEARAPLTVAVESSTPWPLSKVCRRGVFSVVAPFAEGDGGAAVVPVSSGGRPVVLVAGLSPAQPLDPGRRRFLEDAAEHLGAALAAAALHEERSHQSDQQRHAERERRFELEALRGALDEQKARLEAELAAQRSARREAERREEQFRRIVQQARAGIAELNLAGRFVLVNERFCEIARRSEAELKQISVATLLHPDEATPIVERLMRLVHDGTPFTADVRLFGLDGSIGWVQASFSRLDDPRGEPKGVAVAAIDVTRSRFATQALKENEGRLEALAADAQQAADSERALREQAELFAGVLGHDLRNPLGAISSTAELIRMRTTEPRIVTPVDRIITSSRRMERMISQLLDFTRIRLGHGLPLERAEVDLFEICRQAIDEISQQYRRDLVLESAGDGRGRWDRDRLGQLLSNLFGNACQHGAAEAPVNVTLDGTARDTVRLEVRNQGEIPEAVLPRIFEPMRHASSARAQRGGSSGLGLGLFISQQIVLAHQGRITAQSREQSTGFVVELPRLAG